MMTENEQAQQAPDGAREREEPDTYARPAHGWTCFHCGETFTTPGSAEDHFGATPDFVAGCVVKAGSKRGLLMALRRLESALNTALLSADDETRSQVEAVRRNAMSFVDAHHAREREEDARWFDEQAGAAMRLAETHEAAGEAEWAARLREMGGNHARAAAALRGALPDTRALEDAVALALWKAHADATANHSGRILPDFATLPPAYQSTWRRIARAALFGTPEQP